MRDDMIVKRQSGGLPAQSAGRAANIEVVTLLEHTLAAVKAGRWVAVGIITVKDGELAIHTAGGHLAMLHMGAGQMQRQITDVTFQATAPDIGGTGQH